MTEPIEPIIDDGIPTARIVLIVPISGRAPLKRIFTS